MRQLTPRSVAARRARINPATGAGRRTSACSDQRSSFRLSRADWTMSCLAVDRGKRNGSPSSVCKHSGDLPVFLRYAEGHIQYLVLRKKAKCGSKCVRWCVGGRYRVASELRRHVVVAPFQQVRGPCKPSGSFMRGGYKQAALARGG